VSDSPRGDVTLVTRFASRLRAHASRLQAHASRLQAHASGLRAHAAWLVYGAVALACTAYVNARALIVPKWGDWYMANEGHPYILMQVRAMLSGRLALFAHPSGAGNDYDWGRGGMHQAWGLGVPILALPFHLLGRLFGAPGFPDGARFLVLYAATTVALARALDLAAPPPAGSVAGPARPGLRGGPSTAVAASLAAGSVMVFPTFVGMVSSRFLIYEQTIATGALWSVVLLAGTISLVPRCTPGRLALVCAAAGFSILLRPPLAVYGVVTVALALFIGRRKGLRPAALLSALLAYLGSTALYFVGNALRYGSPLVAGFENGVSGSEVNRLTRWGLPFAKTPFLTAAKEMFVTLFQLGPIASQTFGPTAELRPYALGERWREYYAPTFDMVIFALSIVALAIVGWRIVRHRLWRADRDLTGEVMTVVGAWGLPPAIVLFVFFSRIGNMVSRYATDLYPAFAATTLCVGLAVVDVVRRRAPAYTASAQLAIGGAVALYIAGWRGGIEHMSAPVDRKTIVARLAEIDAHSADMPAVPDHFKCGEPRGKPPVHTHLSDWQGDCFFHSGMVFAMPHSRCVSFTFHAGGATWGPAEAQSLAGFRATGDFDSLVSCGAPRVEGDTRRVTMCEPRPPRFLLDGLRLYSIASLDANLEAIDRLKLLRIDSAPSCP